MPTIDPNGWQSISFGGFVIVKETLGHVQEVTSVQPHLGKASEQRLEVGRSGLIGADILGSDDLVERDP